MHLDTPAASPDPVDERAAARAAPLSGAAADAAAGGPGKAAFVRAMFARIVPRYDLVNRLMTLGMDRRWRREAVAIVQPTGALALDIATGTGDLVLELLRQGARHVVGADFCADMLGAAVIKAHRAGADSAGAAFVAGDATRLPFHDDSFDCIVNGFMLRNVNDLAATFSELCRVLKPGGRLACLDLTPPRGPLRGFFGFYIGRLVPLLGGVVSGHYFAYRYLGQSLRPHPDADTLAAIMRAAGLGGVGYRLTGFGTVAIHFAVKPAASERVQSDGRGAA
jgi:demethylmenaquinone methyltransferase/2-methoxy-6-polyprenyl-1,4-benzoquinol methylase